VHALLASREAIACAALGDDRGYRQAITRAWREADRGTVPGDPVWLRFVAPIWDVLILPLPRSKATP
jgi:hypothetical protein